MTITEDTPEGGPEELQWKIDRLIEQVERHAAELERESHAHNSTLQKLHEAQDRYDALTSRLTVGVLRKAGYTVTIEEAEFCEACGEEF
jgi:recombinational DNA repair protein (RecF pathway)